MSAKEPDRLSGLPPEILISIIQKISQRDTVSKLCRVSRLLNSLATPQLYENTVLYFSTKSSDPFHSSFTQSSSKWSRIFCGTGVQYIKHLEFERKIGGPRSKCRHMTKQKKTAADKSSLYEIHFKTFCCRLTANTLRSFSWHLGSCVPVSLLSSGGYLSLFQQSLECLSLITNPDCDEHVSAKTEYDLLAFKNLRKLSWIGPQTMCDYVALKACLDTNAPHLESLSLDLPYWGRKPKAIVSEAPPFDRFDVSDLIKRDILRISANDKHNRTIVRFPALQSLSIRNLCLYDTALERLSTTLSFSQLKSLQLWECNNPESLLDHLNESRQCLQLRCLEIFTVIAFDDVQILTSFLDKLSSLESVFLCLPGTDWNSVGRVICNHTQTLKQVVLHERDVDFDEFLDDIEDETIRDQSLGHFEGLVHLLAASECEIIGLSYNLDDLRSYLADHMSALSCKLLHVRAAGDEVFAGLNKLDGFASWVFGPTGLAGLLVLAYGDFSFPEENDYLYCRNDVVGLGQPAFRQVTSKDTHLWELVQRNMNALTACTYRSMF